MGMARKTLSSAPVAVVFLFLTFQAGCSDLGDAYGSNDCLIVAAKAQYSLPRSTWSRLLVVRYGAGSLQHVYLVYSADGVTLTTFDSAQGTRHIQTGERAADRLARIVDPRAHSGWFIEDNANNRHLTAN